jgi:nucleoside-diphosphate-sugar epimerase
MKVIITGGAGFIGGMLARRLAERGRLTGPSGAAQEIDDLVLFDAVEPAGPPVGLDGRARIEVGDIAERERVFALIDRDDVSVFHLASVVSGEGEENVDLAFRINLDGGRTVMEACRSRGSRPRLVFASSIAAFGGPAMPKVVTDTTKQTPQTTYGATKAICELLVNDYTRKGFLDGRSARLPTIIIRPGRPNRAASGFASAIFREPLNNQPCVLPVAPDTRMPVLGCRAAADNLIRLHELEGIALGEDRALNFPSLSVAIADMIAALKRVAGNRPLGEIRVEPDPFIEKIVATWPVEIDCSRARTLGLVAEDSLDEIVSAYIEDFLKPNRAAAIP